MTDSTAFIIIALLAIGAQGLLLFLAFFEPHLQYKITGSPTCPIDSEDFVRMLEGLADSKLHHKSKIEVLTNGEVYYEAELAAIRTAEQSINLEAYIFQKGEVTRRFVEALTERARAGVKVNIVLDAIGSFLTTRSYFKGLIAAGGKVAYYHPFKWYMLPRINNRTHRELIIIDGKIGFIGGSGFADHWLISIKNKLRWRDTMFRVEGDLVISMQGTFAENWLEASGEVLSGTEYFPKYEYEADTTAFIVNSSPSIGRSTRARMLYQTLFACAQQSILITTPYFLPDRSARAELVKAITERNVDVKIIVPGKHIDHQLTRRSSRRLFGDLLKAGAKIYEYYPSMIHTKSLIVDGKWSVVGSTNLDNRSFGLNDEVNLVALDKGLSHRLTQDFMNDLADSKRISYEQWRHRPIWERVHEAFGKLLERQQ